MKGRTVMRALGTLLRQTDPDADPLVANEADVVSSLPVTLDGGTLTFTLPSHAVAFLVVGT